jgi:hypothetical protein
VVEVTQSKDVGVAAPKPSENAVKTHSTPSTFLIYDLTGSQRLTLLRRYVWSSQAITLRVLPLSPACPSFLFGIRDFTTLSENEVHEVIHNVWHDADSNNFITPITDSVPNTDHSTVESNLRIFIASMYVDRLDVKGSGDALTPQFNVYANGSVIHNDRTWIASVLSQRVDRMRTRYSAKPLPSCSHSIATCATVSTIRKDYALPRR